MNNAAILEWLGDNAFIWITILGSVGIIGYLWFRFNNKERGR